MDSGTRIARQGKAFGNSGPNVIWPVFPQSAARARQKRTLQPNPSVSIPDEALLQTAVDARVALEEAIQAAAAAAQRVRSITAALDQTVGELASSQTMVEQAPTTVVRGEDIEEVLSPREREVLALVAQGRSNKAIAEALFVSPNTIKTHVASLLNKLRAETRVQLAVIAARHMSMMPS